MSYLGKYVNDGKRDNVVGERGTMAKKILTPSPSPKERGEDTYTLISCIYTAKWCIYRIRFVLFKSMLHF